MKKSLWRKRDAVYLVTIVYLLLKLYVLSTPTPLDDNLPDHARDILLQVANN